MAVTVLYIIILYKSTPGPPEFYCAPALTLFGVTYTTAVHDCILVTDSANKYIIKKLILIIRIKCQNSDSKNRIVNAPVNNYCYC